ncbi:hypothetical protein K493DRAFT_316179 [Basidiobolus meristosporus CBS 931.73]|uniref:C3H1-type domain-containing protein n=1 Tax=Basidiobolus meristosporus CBS 931.73 TaxID=1314790 RepID=A0A1Y1Y5W6_9FUNG|nr:hypothetical protein K493DRAFT_316179 [Basidiobolus meristosporus CBS 931.73]|eukprot:ORX93096.1 hypothetical protein K493DRAFT_316179 [Basidiobolus meristosporus CBS 931.73]
MVKKFYCDFCDRQFPDNLDSRKKHLESTGHQAQVKLHYDSFRDPVALIQEQLHAPPCRKFMSIGRCEYGLSCKYSHFPYGVPKDLYAHPDLAALLNRTERKSNSNAAKYSVPKDLPKNLPPSLRPPPLHGYQYHNVEEWG